MRRIRHACAHCSRQEVEARNCLSPCMAAIMFEKATDSNPSGSTHGADALPRNEIVKGHIDEIIKRWSGHRFEILTWNHLRDSRMKFPWYAKENANWAMQAYCFRLALARVYVKSAWKTLVCALRNFKYSHLKCSQIKWSMTRWRINPHWGIIPSTVH
jgi:hypothetical protein